MKFVTTLAIALCLCHQAFAGKNGDDFLCVSLSGDDYSPKYLPPGSACNSVKGGSGKSSNKGVCLQKARCAPITLDQKAEIKKMASDRRLKRLADFDKGDHSGMYQDRHVMDMCNGYQSLMITFANDKAKVDDYRKQHEKCIKETVEFINSRNGQFKYEDLPDEEKRELYEKLMRKAQGVSDDDHQRNIMKSLSRDGGHLEYGNWDTAELTCAPISVPETDEEKIYDRVQCPDADSCKTDMFEEVPSTADRQNRMMAIRYGSDPATGKPKKADQKK